MSAGHYSVYKAVVEQLMSADEHLPSLPEITLKIRQAIADPNITSAKLANMLEADPSLCALVIRLINSPAYRTEEKLQTLESAITHLGLSAIDSIAMIHSVRSVFVIRNAALKNMFADSWRRIIVKAAICKYLGKKLAIFPVERFVAKALMSEVGTLAAMSAFHKSEQTPDRETFYRLCREYSKSIGIIIVKKWDMGEEYAELIRYCGCWEKTTKGKISDLDVINLSLYHTIKMQNPEAQLPEITKLAAYPKLPPLVSILAKDGSVLQIVKDAQQEIIESAQSLG